MTPATARATALGAGGTVLTGTVMWWLLRTATRSWPGGGRVEVDAGLVFLTTLAAGLVAGWAALLLLTATASLLVPAWRDGGERRVRSEAPGARRGLTGRVAAGLLAAASLGAAPAALAQPPTAATVAVTLSVAEDGAHPARTGVPPGGDDAAGEARDAPVPGWTPTVTQSPPLRHPTGEISLVSTSVAGTEADEVVVRRGDTLWAIAARHLGDHATDQDVAEAWPRWYAANRDVIGGDPDLIQPGQRLVVPSDGGAR